MKQLTEQLEHQYELHKVAASRARKAECDATEWQKRLQSAEGELAAGDCLRDGFRSDKEMVLPMFNLTFSKQFGNPENVNINKM